LSIISVSTIQWGTTDSLGFIFILDICWCWFHSHSFNLWAMWAYTTHSNEIWFNTHCSKNWRFVHTLYLATNIIHLTGLVDVPTLNSTLIWSLALYFLIWNVSPFQLLLFIHLVFFSWASSWYNFQDFTTRYSTLIMIGIEHKHKVLSQMDSILMGLMPEVLIMLLIG
jgi:hypothetical protein